MNRGDAAAGIHTHRLVSKPTSKPLQRPDQQRNPETRTPKKPLNPETLTMGNIITFTTNGLLCGSRVRQHLMEYHAMTASCVCGTQAVPPNLVRPIQGIFGDIKQGRVVIGPYHTASCVLRASTCRLRYQ
jgi:hypothetical protein